MVTLKEVTVIRAPIARCFDLARSVEAHLAGNVHWGEVAVAEDGITSGLVDLGQCDLACEALCHLAAAHERDHRDGSARVLSRHDD